MKSKIERQWWWAGAVSGISVALTFVVLNGAHVPDAGHYNGFHFVLFLCCCVGFAPTLSFLAWFALLMVSPATLERFDGPRAIKH